MIKPTFSPVRVFTSNPLKIKQASNLARDRIMARMLQKTNVIKKDIQTVIKTEQSRGRRYYSRNPFKKFHVASLPGFPPNEDTGHLRQGVMIKSALKSKVPFIELSVSPKNELRDYAPYLEFGTKSMEPRPFFYTTIEKAVKSPLFQKAIRQVQFAIKNDLQGRLLERKLGRK